MKKACLTFGLALTSGLALAAGWETADEPRLYGAEFADYAEGEKLSDKGATGGHWNDAEGERTSAGTVGGRKCMTCESASLLFNASPGLDGPKVSKVSAYLPGSPGLGNLLETDKAAFAIRLPAEGESGKPVFAGWSGTAWHDLFGSVEPMTNTWYDLSVWVVKNLEDQRLVQYRLKVGNEYEPLHTADGEAWLNSGLKDGDAAIREIEIRGSGAFDLLWGRELPSPGLSVHCK